jgi:hypothetical protein
MVAMSMGEHRPIDRPPRIDPKAALGAIEAAVIGNQER